MRPVDKGPWPIDPGTGQQKKYSPYGTAKRDLLNRLGHYCSYCEQNLPGGAEVEHIQPKSLVPALMEDWDNFLLGCKNCNTVKGNKTVDVNDYYWPDKHNTSLIFTCNKAGVIEPAANLTPAQKILAQNMIALVGLDKVTPNPGTKAYDTASDLRHENRLKSKILAEDYEAKYSIATVQVKQIMAICLVDIVRGDGFWSVWMNVFKNHTEIKLAFIQGFTNTANCFDANGDPVNRNGTDI